MFCFGSTHRHRLAAKRFLRELAVINITRTASKKLDFLVKKHENQIKNLQAAFDSRSVSCYSNAGIREKNMDRNVSPAVKVYRWEHYQRDRDFPLNVTMVQDRRAATALHTHDFEELLLVANGTGVYDTPAGSYQLRQGDVFLLHPGQIHGFSRQHHLVIYNLLWRERELGFDWNSISGMPGYHLFFHLEPNSRERIRFKQHLHLDQPELDRVRSLLEEIRSEVVQHREGYPSAVRSLLGLLFVTICRACTATAKDRDNDLQKLANAIHYMTEHYSQPLNRARLARIANMSEATFFRHFRRTTGMSPTDYLRNLRLSRAEVMLRTTDMPQAEISERCGFCDGNYFIMCFRERYRITPHKYRKLFRRADGEPLRRYSDAR